MEITAASIKPHYHHHHTYNVVGVPISPPNSHTKALVPNGIDNNHHCCCCCCRNISADIEMITLQAAAYTSLKDLMPTSPCPPNTPVWSTMSPATAGKDGLRDIPINLKDPLLQHAAWAYLQPAMTPHDHRAHRSFLQNLKHHFCGAFGCFNDVLHVLLNTWFPANDGIRRRRRRGGRDDEEEMGEEDQENAAAPARDASWKKTTKT